jgi:hypothetical protein
MHFPTSILQSLLALYGFGQRAHPSRRRPAPVVIGHPPVRRA